MALADHKAKTKTMCEARGRKRAVGVILDAVKLAAVQAEHTAVCAAVDAAIDEAAVDTAARAWLAPDGDPGGYSP